ncbi:hypothetical protein EDD99_5099 [Streptomyces sp. 846.5]|nr:hypothetical protein [Streptomyces sp. 846.5]TDU06538.1 hypothetical protein EDD99_5099 [Streptomyces sp. 846.5]
MFAAEFPTDPFHAALPNPAPTPSCDLVRVPERQGLETVDILRLRGACGPVLLEDADATLSFLVPAGAVDTWQLPGGSCTQALAPDDDGAWLLPPSPERALTDPAQLCAALGEAARTLAASGSAPAADGA